MISLKLWQKLGQFLEVRIMRQKILIQDKMGKRQRRDVKTYT